jgi:hypothetical protein
MAQGCAITTFALAALWAGAVSAAPADVKTCSGKFSRATELNSKDNEALQQKIRKANYAAMAKDDPLKYCGWHKVNVLPVLIKSMRRMEALANDADCANETAAAVSLERLVVAYKQDERGLSGLCLGLKNE